MIERIYINNDWLFTNDKKEKEIVDIPHTVKEIPFNYFDQEIYQFISSYEKEINLNKYLDKNIFLTFEGVAHKATIFLNDKEILVHEGGYDKFSINIKDYLKKGNNKLKVFVDSNEDLNIPPFGKVVDYLTYGGIYRDVYLDVFNDNYIKDVFVMPKHNDNWNIDLNVELTSPLNYEVIIKYEDEVIHKEKVNNKDLISKINIGFKDPKLWDINNPNLYELVVNLLEDDKIIDTYKDKFGLRVVKFKTDGFYLNDKKIKIVGLNRHQSYPYVGYAMPEGIQREDARILKYELGVNAVRTSHYMQSQYFIDECDKIGLMVFTESPGWQYVGDDKWKSLALEFMRKMVVDYRNHPSIILWGARINESRDDHDFYLKSNEMIHKLDPTRQTGGVRCYKKGEELEDVYTYNDFIPENQGGGLEKKKDVVTNINIPYFISEYNGHMYPTKSYDDELHLEHQAKNIARGLDKMYDSDDILGLFSWCMFDYNTHKDFGSGDKICYHGVMDMFRNKKPAGYLYSSINDVDTLYVTSNMNHGNYPGGNIFESLVFTNADSVKIYKNNELIREYYHTDTDYKNLPNAPIKVDDFVGDLLITKEGYSKKESDDMKLVLKATLLYGAKMPFKYKLKYLKLILFHHVTYELGYELYGKYIGGWGDKETIYSFEAIKDNKVVKKVTLGDAKKLHIDARPFRTTLSEKSTYDAVSIRIRVLDQNNNQALYYQEPFTLSTSGPIKIIGPSLLSFKGGMLGTYIRTTGIKGKASLSIKTEFEEKTIDFEVK